MLSSFGFVRARSKRLMRLTCKLARSARDSWDNFSTFRLFRMFSERILRSGGVRADTAQP